MKYFKNVIFSGRPFEDFNFTEGLSLEGIRYSISYRGRLSIYNLHKNFRFDFYTIPLIFFSKKFFPAISYKAYQKSSSFRKTSVENVDQRTSLKSPFTKHL